MKIETKIHDTSVEFFWDKKLRFINRNSIGFDYGVNISKIPRHIVNFMFGIIMSEHFAWNKGTVHFDELTEKELQCINDFVRYNFKSNPYKRCDSEHMTVIADKIVDSQYDTIIDKGVVLCGNGMGKDGLSISSIVKELGFKQVPFTAGSMRSNQYLNIPRGKEIWKERVRAMVDYYKYQGIKDYHFIKNTYLINNSYKVMTWPIWALPLAYYYGSNTILSGLCVHDNLFDMRGYTIRPNISIFAYKYLSKVTGIDILSPFWSLSYAGVQKLLIQRYPDIAKYQRSCMRSVNQWCNNIKCGKCYGISSILQALKIKGQDIGFPVLPTYSDEKPLRYNHPFNRCAYIETDRKVRGERYQDWIFKYNSHGLKHSWESKKIGLILDEHFVKYSKDPGNIGFNLSLRPSKWQELITTGFNKYWGLKQAPKEDKEDQEEMIEENVQIEEKSKMSRESRSRDTRDSSEKMEIDTSEDN